MKILKPLAKLGLGNIKTLKIPSYTVVYSQIEPETYIHRLQTYSRLLGDGDI
jgi:hypothetical protein